MKGYNHSSCNDNQDKHFLILKVNTYTSKALVEVESLIGW